MILPSFALPLHIIVLLGAGWLVSIGVIWFVMDLRYYGKEGFDIRRCRKNQLTYNIDVDIGSGNAQGYVAERTKKGAGRIFNKTEAGAKLDPSISMGQDEPFHFPRGLDVQIHGTLDAWPTSLKTAAGIAKIKMIRQYEQYEPLDPIPDKELIELLDTQDDHLPHDARLFIERYKIPNPEATQEELRLINLKLDEIAKKPSHRVINWMQRDDLAMLLQVDEFELPILVDQLIGKYFEGTGQEIPKDLAVAVLQKVDDLKQDPVLSNLKSPTITPARMLELINELKDETTRAVIDPKFRAFRSALKDNPNAFKTTDVTTLESILRQMITEDMLHLFNWKSWGIIAMGIIGVTGAVIIIGAIALGKS